MTDAAEQTRETRPSTEVRAGGTVAAFVPTSLAEAKELATLLASRGGDMVPKDYRNNPGAVFLAMSKGAELGMAPLASLQSIACINGRATVWGDALPGLVLRAGHKLEEWIEGRGDNMVAHCKLTRRDGAVIERTFSVDDAKAAKLWGKTGRNGEPTPWVTYPKRMLQMRARGFACRDGAADVLMGLAVREETEDMRAREARDVTPKDYSPLAERIREHRAEREAAEAPADPAEPEAEAEVMQADDLPAPGVDPAKGFPMDPEWDQGFDAYHDGSALTDNPHTGQQANSWAGGWINARDQEALNAGEAETA